MSPAIHLATSVCILGMHRSGTSTITRAVNLLGAFLGDDTSSWKRAADNPRGFWEHPRICDVHVRLLAHLNRSWDTANPLPPDWHRSESVRPFKDELRELLAKEFSTQPLWAWKDPRTCLLLPLWRDLLAERQTRLLCVFMVRNPLDVANSLGKREPVRLNHAVGAWFNYTVTALRDAAGLPTAFLSYDRLLTGWEPELRRCAATLSLNWPKDEDRLRREMNAFIQPGLRHHQTSPARLRELPHPVQELYHVLEEASTRPTLPDAGFHATIRRLARDFFAYAPFFEPSPAAPPRPWPRLLERWQKSLRKRLPGAKARP